MSMSAAWLWLTAAIALEVAGTMCLKLSAGFSRWLPSVLILVFYAGAFAALVMALKRIELGVAYAVWAAAGTVLVAVLGAVLFRESLSMLKVAGIALVVFGVVLLHLAERTSS